jgi:putative PIN family toxin of toxin-antitoxin system
MKIILDTNVFVSGVFFSGPPYEILKGWRDGKFQLVVSQEILEEYHRVGETLGKQFSKVNLEPIFELLTIEAHIVTPPILPENVCNDSDDDKFIACAIASQTWIIVSGDKHLLDVSGYYGIEVLRPRLFIEKYLKS